MPIAVLVVAQSLAFSKVIQMTLRQAGVQLNTYNWWTSWKDPRREPLTAKPDLVITEDLGDPPPSVMDIPTIKIAQKHRPEKGEISRPFTAEDMKKAMTSVGFSLS